MNLQHPFPDNPATPELPRQGQCLTAGQIDDFALMLDNMTPDQREQVEEHLTSCPRCRLDVEQLRYLLEEETLRLDLARGNSSPREFFDARLAAWLAADEEVDVPGLPIAPVAAAAQAVVAPLCVVDRPALEPAIAQPATVGEQLLVNLFYPRDAAHSTISKRLAEETLAKVALGGPCLDYLVEHRYEQVFVEGGSSTALGFQAIMPHLRPGDRVTQKLRPCSNNQLLNGALWASVGLSCPTLFGNRHFNLTYAEYFPVSTETIERAYETIERASGLPSVERAHVMATPKGENPCIKVRKAWIELVTAAMRFEVLFMTASRFHFFAGPFVGSKDNALLKAAFSLGKNLIWMIDGSKLLLTADLLREYGCIMVIDHYFDNPSNDSAFKALYRQKPWSEELLTRRTQASDRNPTVKLRLRQCDVRYRVGPSRFREEEVTTPGTWAECVERTLRRGGEVLVYISEPAKLPGGIAFATYLCKAIAESNECFARLPNCRVRLGEPIPSSVGVNRQTLAVDPASPEKITVWSCPMILLPDHRSAALATKASESTRH